MRLSHRPWSRRLHRVFARGNVVIGRSAFHRPQLNAANFTVKLAPPGFQRRSPLLHNVEPTCIIEGTAVSDRPLTKRGHYSTAIPSQLGAFPAADFWDENTAKCSFVKRVCLLWQPETPGGRCGQDGNSGRCRTRTCDPLLVRQVL